MRLLEGVNERTQQDLARARLAVSVEEFYVVLGTSDRESSEELAGIASQKR